MFNLFTCIVLTKYFFIYTYSCPFNFACLFTCMLHILHKGTETIMKEKTGHIRELLKSSVLTMSSPFPPSHKEKNEDNRLHIQEREDKRLFSL